MTTHDSRLDERDVDDAELDDTQLDDTQLDAEVDAEQVGDFDLDAVHRAAVRPPGDVQSQDEQLYARELEYEPDDGMSRAQRRALRRQQLVGSVLLARLATAGLWLVVIGAFLVALFALFVALTRAQAPAAVSEIDITPGDGAVRASSFAEMAVRQYLGAAGEGTEDVVAPFIAEGEVPELQGVTPEGFYVVHVATVDVDELGQGYWEVTVAADLMAANDGTYEPVGVRHYGMGVLIDEGDGGATLVDLPSQVPAPPAVESQGLLAASLGAPNDSPQVDAAKEFLGALLLGEGSIQRFIAPDAEIVPIDPPPFAALQIDQASVVTPEADATAVRLSVLAVDERGLAQRLHYTLGMRQREGRWEVAELFTAPLLSSETYPPSGDGS